MRRTSLSLAAVTAAVLVGSVLSAAPASAAGGSISGRMLAQPVGGVPAPYDAPGLQLYYSETSEFTTQDVEQVEVAADGTFTATDLADGWYWLRAYGGDYNIEYYDDVFHHSAATPIRVSGNAVTLEKDIVLEKPGAVTGRVVNEEGEPLVGANVTFTVGTGGGLGVSTDAQGRFDSRDNSFLSLVPGTYELDVYSWSQDLDQPIYETGKAEVVVTAGGVVDREIVLVERPSAVVTVLDPAGEPLPNAVLGIQVRTDEWMDGQWGPIQSGPHETDATGRYRFASHPGEIRFQVRPPEDYTGPAVAQWWDGAYSFREATTLAFPEGVAMRRDLTVQLGADTTAVRPAVPTISGEVRVGRTLAADPGTWAPAGVALDYQWLDNGFVIPGATGRTFTIPESLESSWIAVRVTGTVANEPAVDRLSAFTGEVQPADGTSDLAPVKPRISGAPVAGRTLTAVPGDWGQPGVSFSYAWAAGGRQIGTGRTLKVTNALAGRRITLTVRGSLAGASPAAATSAPTAAARGRIAAVRPRVAGKARVGRVLTARPGAWKPGKVTLRYAWFRNAVQVKGATGKKYRLTRKDAGKRISVRVVGTRPHFARVITRSARTARVVR